MTVKTGLLLSGGIDSIAIAFWKRPDIALTIDYGQLSALGETQAAAAVCASLGIPHEILRIDCSALGSGDLAGRAHLPQAPVTEWWPYRNQLLVTIGAAYLMSFDVSALLLGCVRTDASHADGLPDFIDLLSRLLGLQEGKMRLSAPAQALSSIELIRESNVPRDLLAWAHSCHVSNFACGYCRGCQKHFETMKAIGLGPY